MKRKILAVTGIRSEYDIMYPVFKSIDSHPDLSLELLVTGAHLSKTFGYTIEQIRKDGFIIADEVESLINSDQKGARIKGGAVQLAGIVQTVSRVKPNFLMALGDREEAMMTALAGTYMDIPVVHIAGGDMVIGNIDDVIRHAVTKLAHLHFATNEESRQRILNLGEESFRVFNSGNPGLDRFAQIPSMTREDIFAYFGFPPGLDTKPLLIVVQHVLSSEIQDAYTQMTETLEAVQSLEFPTVISYPNSDAGTREIIRCIESIQHLDYIKIFQNVPRTQFVNTLRHAACLVGNSSLGILEAPFLKLPAINIGNRQAGRLHGDNIIFVPHDRKHIIENIKKACFNNDFILRVKNGNSPYGDGNSSQRIVNVLSEIKINPQLLIKRITY